MNHEIGRTTRRLIRAAVVEQIKKDAWKVSTAAREGKMTADQDFQETKSAIAVALDAILSQLNEEERA